jgi:hypothetical protein
MAVALLLLVEPVWLVRSLARAAADAGFDAGHWPHCRSISPNGYDESHGRVFTSTRWTACSRTRARNRRAWRWRFRSPGHGMSQTVIVDYHPRRAKRNFSTTSSRLMLPTLRIDRDRQRFRPPRDDTSAPHGDRQRHAGPALWGSAPNAIGKRFHASGDGERSSAWRATSSTRINGIRGRTYTCRFSSPTGRA